MVELWFLCELSLYHEAVPLTSQVTCQSSTFHHSSTIFLYKPEDIAEFTARVTSHFNPHRFHRHQSFRLHFRLTPNFQTRLRTGVNRLLPSFFQSIDRNIVVRSHARVSSLTLKNVQFTYAGQYLCSATNSIGQDNQPVYLEVRCESTPPIQGLRDTLSCAVKLQSRIRGFHKH